MKKTTHECSCPITGLPVNTVLLTLILIGGAILGSCVYSKLNAIHKATIDFSFGSQANFEKLFEARMTPETKKQIDEEIKKSIESFKNTTTPEATASEEQGTTSSTELSNEEITTLVGATPTLGGKQADILVLEYADFLCGYCKKLHDEKTLENLSEQHPEVAVAVKAIPLFGVQSQPAAYGAHCAAQLGGDAAYYSYIDQAFSNQVTTTDGAISIAKPLGLDEAKFASCIADTTTTETVNAAFPLAAEKFGLTGTPASVIINTKTGKYEVVGGAYPLSYFESALEKVK